MSLALLDRLTIAHEALIGALDSNDISAIEAATAELAAAVQASRDAVPALAGTAARERLASLAALAQAAQVRVNFLTDGVRRRMDTLAMTRGRVGNLTYGPAGR